MLVEWVKGISSLIFAVFIFPCFLPQEISKFLENSNVFCGYAANINCAHSFRFSL